MSSSFLRADGTLAPPRHRWWSNWLPSLNQVQEAIQLRFATAPDTSTSTGVWSLTMRQGLGLVVFAAILAGLLPFVVNTVNAIRLGSPLPFIQLAEQVQDAPSSPFGESLRTLAGLAPSILPRWLAALLSTIGEWINWPLRWLTWWLVYGTATLLAAKAWGAPTTLQRFLAATSYAAVPMILTTLSPIPFLGFLATLVAIVWMAAVYVGSVAAVTGLDWGRAALAAILPAVLVSFVGFILAVTTAASLLRMMF